ncbi:tyrosine-type recombinase/integrase [Legionella feeleii]|uniref:Integrase n=1 Tax=Legionella feeleii TaxID=453 RepID=A0A0W0U836_9GAMM|nr:integrase arm-type DNA-binding domain-containing protein [Legionella feeleii]KTD04162.1 integrase [Legionella feeleii]SPX60726.1 integrase [Legionella feeleii]
MKLTLPDVKKKRELDKPLKLSDGQGLFLLIQPNGKKYWRYSYRFDGKQKTLALGVFPEVSLAEARDLREEARALLKKTKVDPGEHRKALKQARTSQDMDSFEVVAREWFANQSSVWVPTHADKIIRRLERDIFPWLGASPIASITAQQLLIAARRIEERGVKETARRALLNCSQVFRYAIATGRAERDPVPDLKGALQPAKTTHFATMTEPKAIGELLRAIDNYHGSFVTKCALQIAPMVFVRPGELRAAEWCEIDLDTAEWNIKAERMKMRVAHLVPLSRQTVSILRELYPLTGHGKYVFASEHTSARPMSENTLNFAFRRMGFAKTEISAHGFRAMARTILDEILHIRPDYIEHQLAHAVRDPNGRAYNRTSHLLERKVMMQKWADYLDGLKSQN